MNIDKIGKEKRQIQAIQGLPLDRVLDHDRMPNLSEYLAKIREAINLQAKNHIQT